MCKNLAKANATPWVTPEVHVTIFISNEKSTAKMYGLSRFFTVLRCLEDYFLLIMFVIGIYLADLSDQSSLLTGLINRVSPENI